MKQIEKDLKYLLKEKYNLTDLQILNRKLPESKNFQSDYRKLKNKVPVAYLIGDITFLGTKIDLSLKPLIPRSETEFWVNEAITNLTSLDKNIMYKMLDIYCGSGCIGLSLLKAFDNITVDFADNSLKMLKQTSINLKLNKIAKSRYKLKRSSNLSNVNSRYDFIFANPPYISLDAKVSEGLSYEPRNALFSGKTGLQCITSLLQNVHNNLKPDGVLYMEYGYGQKLKVEKILQQTKLFKYSFKKDQYGKYRYVILNS